MKQVVLLTGASGGIGQAIVSRLVRRGHHILATDIAPQPVAGAVHRRLDVSCAKDWREALEEAEQRWGRVDVLINGAGLARAGRYHKLEVDQIDKHLDVNLKGAALGMRLVLPQMLARNSGHLINIGSLAAVAPVPGIALYSATKFALRGLSLALASELVGTEVAVSLVHPDLVDTPMIAEQRHQADAAISFSGSAILSADAVAAVITERVMRTKPLEVFVPRHRGALARISGNFPRVGQLMAPMLRKRGLKHQARERNRKGET